MKKYYREVITKNALKCLACDDIIESEHVHDFKWCKCGSVAVDGGKEYLKRVGDFHNVEDLSESYLEEREPYEWET